jgi:hypothetical protein
MEFLASFTGDAQRHLYLHHRDQQILMTGVILLTLTKQDTPEGYSGWMANRIRSFSGSLGISSDYLCWTTDQYPDQECMTILNSFFSANFDLRRHIFLLCVSASMNTEHSANLFRDAVNLMQGSEMNHILLIDYYIFNKYPELLRIRILKMI